MGKKVADLPLVSVIIPCYRQGHLLPEALESVLAQTYPAVEAVVVNDGSPDDTDEVVHRYLPRVRYVRQQNRGLPAARNAGIRASSGQYLLFLDADDLLYPKAVEWLVEAASRPDGLSHARPRRRAPGARGMGPATPRVVPAHTR
jgi:glycosyltransferase involved in cell wall biosynthesis